MISDLLTPWCNARRLRAYARAAEVGVRAHEPAIAVEDPLDAEALGPALALALADLSPALREVLVLHAWVVRAARSAWSARTI